MASNVGFGMKILMFMLITNFMFFMVGGATGVWEGFGSSEDIFSDQLKYSYNRSDPMGVIEIDDTEGYGMNDTEGKGTTSGLFVVVDYLEKAKSTFNFVKSFLYAPYYILKDVGAPAFLVYLVQSMWSLMYIIMFLQFVRSGGSV